jgi:drug/metabolite transporter (DMT)-like permease
LVYLVIVSLVWGLSFVIIKGTLTTLDSNFVSLVRILLSFLIFIPFVRQAGISWSDRLHLMMIGAVQFGLMYVSYVASFQYIPAHVIALMTTTTPLFVTVFNDLFKRKVNLDFFLAASLAVAGGAVLKLPDGGAGNWYGIMLLQISNAAFAFGQIAYKRFMDKRKIRQDKSVFGFMYAGALMVTVLFSAVTTDYGNLAVETGQWVALAYLGIFASGICFFLWNTGARAVNAGTLAVMNNMKIPVGVVGGLVILRESTDLYRLGIGCVLFAAALWVNGRLYGRSSSRRDRS